MSLLNQTHEDGIQKLLDLAKDSKLPIEKRRSILDAVDDILEGKRQYDERIRELEELLYRNPSFPGDMIGWWDDDDEEDEDT